MFATAQEVLEFGSVNQYLEQPSEYCGVIRSVVDLELLQEQYRHFRYAALEYGRVDWSNISIDLACRHIDAVDWIIMEFFKNGYSPQNLSQQVTEFGSVLPIHIDDNVLTECSKFTCILPVAHDGKFSVHVRTERDFKKLFHFDYGPGDLLIMNQDPPTYHSAISKKNDRDLVEGFTDRRILSLEFELST